MQGLLLNDKLDASIISPSMKSLSRLDNLKNDIAAMGSDNTYIKKNILDELNFK